MNRSLNYRSADPIRTSLLLSAGLRASPPDASAFLNNAKANGSIAKSSGIDTEIYVFPFVQF